MAAVSNWSGLQDKGLVQTMMESGVCKELLVHVLFVDEAPLQVESACWWVTTVMQIVTTVM